MSEMKLDTAKIDKAVSMALLDTVQLLQGKIIEITPRDPSRPPKNINRKDGKAPSRKGGVTSFGGNYYAQVTGTLKKSIIYNQVGHLEYKIGTIQGDAEYGKFLEFGTSRMQPRSFLRKGIIDGKKEAISNFKKRFNQVIKTY